MQVSMLAPAHLLPRGLSCHRFRSGSRRHHRNSNKGSNKTERKGETAMKRILTNLVLPAAALFVMAGGAAQAYNYNTCNGNAVVWGGASNTMQISTVSFPPGTSWDSDIQDAMWHWNNVKGSRFNYYYTRGSGHSLGNGKNEMYFDATEASGSTLAITHTNYHCYWLFGWNYGIDETDIAFNTNAGWNTGAFNYSNLGSPFDFEQVAEHELGHALGLNHENRWLALMNAYYPNGGPLGYYKEHNPSGDDRGGARVLYSDGTTEVDVAGAALTFTGGGNSGLVSSPSYAARGSNVTIQWTFTNLSTATETFDVGFYLSSDSYIDTRDIWLGTNYGAWGSAGYVGTFSRTLYIPTWVAPGTYYLGFLIDPTNALPDADRGNNNQPMPRTIVIY
jgi:hypothetical protein